MIYIKNLKKVLKCTKGEGYIDTIVLVLSAILIIAFAINLFPAYMAKQKVDTFATEIMREAEIAGRIGSETTAEEARLKENLGIDPTVTWSTSGSVQLNGEISVIVQLEMDIGLFGNIGSFPVTLTGKAIGKSEVYWK